MGKDQAPIRKMVLDRLIRLFQSTSLQMVIGDRNVEDTTSQDWRLLVNLFEGFPAPHNAWVETTIHDKIRESIRSQVDQCSRLRKENRSEAHCPGKILLETSRASIDLLAQVFGKESLTYKYIADEVAEELFACALAYHNAWLDKTDDQAHLLSEALSLASAAKGLAIGLILRNRIESDLPILEANSRQQTKRMLDVQFRNLRIKAPTPPASAFTINYPKPIAAWDKRLPLPIQKAFVKWKALLPGDRVVLSIAGMIVLIVTGTAIVHALQSDTSPIGWSSRDTSSGGVPSEVPVFNPSPPPPPTPPLPAPPQAPELPPAQMPPAHGQTWNLSGRTCEAPLSIATPRGVGYMLLRLKDVRTGRTAFEAFIYVGEPFRTKVPFGTYRLYWAEGTTWYGRKKHFGPSAIISRAEPAMTFWSDDANGQVMGHRLSLELTSSGNMESAKVNPVEFE